MKFANEAQYLEWIKGFTKLKHRKTGTPEGRLSAEYVKDTFDALGLEDVKIEKAVSTCMDVKKCYLKINDKEYNCFFSNGTGRKADTGTFKTGEEGETYEVLYLHDGLETDFEGIDVTDKIVLCDIRFSSLHPSEMYGWHDGAEVYDPEGKINKPLKKFDIYTPNNWPANYNMAMRKGAKGFIGILENFMDCNYYHEDYTEVLEMFAGGFMSIPAMWISRADGPEVRNLFQAGESVTCESVTEVSYEKKTALNVSGVLPGKSDDIILIHSHHDAVCEGAVQDASGMSEVFALAYYFSQMSEEEREKTLMFAATDTHYTDYEGHIAFIQQRQKNGENIILDCAIEHIAKEMDLDDDYNIILHDEPETRMLYVTDTHGLISEMKQVLEKYGLDKTFIYPVYSGADDTHQHGNVCSDAYEFDQAGIPVISVLAAPMYLFHNTDTLDKIYVPGLVPIGKAYAEMIMRAFRIF